MRSNKFVNAKQSKTFMNKTVFRTTCACSYQVKYQQNKIVENFQAQSIFFQILKTLWKGFKIKSMFKLCLKIPIRYFFLDFKVHGHMTYFQLFAIHVQFEMSLLRFVCILSTLELSFLMYVIQLHFPFSSKFNSKSYRLSELWSQFCFPHYSLASIS